MNSFASSIIGIASVLDLITVGALAWWRIQTMSWMK